MSEGILDKITRQAGRGIDDFINGIISKVDRALTAGVGLLGGDSAPTAEKGKASGAGGWFMTLLSGGEPEVPSTENPPKVGGNAVKADILAAMPEDRGPNHASRADDFAHGINFSAILPASRGQGASV